MLTKPIVLALNVLVALAVVGAGDLAPVADRVTVVPDMVAPEVPVVVGDLALVTVALAVPVTAQAIRPLRLLLRRRVLVVVGDRALARVIRPAIPRAIRRRVVTSSARPVIEDGKSIAQVTRAASTVFVSMVSVSRRAFLNSTSA